MCVRILLVSVEAEKKTGRVTGEILITTINLVFFLRWSGYKWGWVRKVWTSRASGMSFAGPGQLEAWWTFLTLLTSETILLSHELITLNPVEVVSV